jgi:hypothetical protein
MSAQIWSARDVKDNILAKLNVTSSSESRYPGLAYYITAINTERSETTPLPAQITSGVDNGGIPCVFVDLGDSTFNETRANDWNVLRETLQLQVTSKIKAGDMVTLDKYCETYLEGILRTLTGYSEDGGNGKTFECIPTETARIDITSDKQGMQKLVGVLFNVERNF